MLAMLCCFFWGANALAISFSVDDLPPLGAAGLRFAIGFCVTLLYAKAMGVRLRLNRAELTMAVVNAGILVVQIGTFNWGTQHTLAARATVLITGHAVFVTLFAPFVAGGETLTARKLIGLAACSAGLLCVFGDHVFSWDPGTLVGDCVVLVSSVLLGLKVAYMKRCVATVEPSKLLVWQAGLAVPVFFAYSAAFEGLDAYNWTPRAAAAIAYQGFIVAGFCFIVWTALLKRHDAGALSIFAFTSPLFGVTLSLALRPGEHASLPLVGGAVLVAAGILIVTTGGGKSEIRMSKSETN